MSEQMQSEFDVCENTDDLLNQSEDLYLTAHNLLEAVQAQTEFGGFDTDPSNSNLALCSFLDALRMTEATLQTMRDAAGYLAECMRGNSVT